MQDPQSTHSNTALGVRLRGIRRVFDNSVVALDGIDLDVAPGEFLAILGPSGCGKSTLLRLIAGLDQPQSGTIHVNRQSPPVSDPVASASRTVIGEENKADPTTLDYARHSRADVAYVFQDAHLLPWRTVLQNVALPLELMHANKSDRLAAAAEAIEQVGLGEAINRYPNQLSGGQRMRVSLARAMVTSPALLLLDEPFAALDEITRQKLDEQLRQLWLQRGMTVIFVTHSTQEAVFLAQRAAVMTRRPGRFVHDAQLDLPAERPSMIRATPAFVHEMRLIYESLEKGGA